MSQVSALPPDAAPTALLEELQLQVKRQQLLIHGYEQAIRNICHDLETDMERGGIPDSYRFSILSLRALITPSAVSPSATAIDNGSIETKALVAGGRDK